MKKNLCFILSIIIISLLIIIGIFISKFVDQLKNLNQIENKNDISINNSKEKKYIDYWLNNLTLDEKIAQMLIIYYSSSTVDETLLNLVKNPSFGGFIVMGNNITTYDKTKNFIETLKKNSKLPLIISIDQEGGSVQRLKNLKDCTPTNIPYMYNLGLTNNTDLAYQTGGVIAKELRSIGVNVNFAPVLDIYNNKDNKVIGYRSFGTTSKIVSLMGLQVGKGMLDNGVIPTYKHFPGHGNTSTDSHIELPIINKTKTELMENELKPFIEAINANAQLIMIGHLAVPKITGNNEPATLSKKLITELLKNELKYKGLVITDALNMKALTNNYTDEEIYTKAINSGCDLLLMPNGSENAIKYIKKNISEERINESVTKILKFKYQYLQKDNLLSKNYLNKQEHINIINRINK